MKGEALIRKMITAFVIISFEGGSLLNSADLMWFYHFDLELFERKQKLEPKF